MTAKQKNLGELELTILKTIWEAPDSTVQEIAEKISAQRNCARTTVLTVMQRLHSKGFLKRRKIAGVFRYAATKDRVAVMSNLIGQFVDRVLDGSTVPFLSYLSTNEDLTPEQEEELQSIINLLERREKGNDDE